MNRHLLISIMAAAGFGLVSGASLAADTKAAPAGTAVKLSPAQYDVYEPSSRQVGRRQGCMSDEAPAGSNCIKKCQTDYRMEISGKTAKCISEKPLPPGTAPKPPRKETAVSPPPLVPRAFPPKPGN